MQSHASAAARTHTGTRAMPLRTATVTRPGTDRLSRRARRRNFAVVALFVLAGLSLSIGARLLLPDTFDAPEQGTFLSP